MELSEAQAQNIFKYFFDQKLDEVNASDIHFAKLILAQGIIHSRYYAAIEKTAFGAIGAPLGTATSIAGLRVNLRMDFVMSTFDGIKGFDNWNILVSGKTLSGKAGVYNSVRDKIRLNFRSHFTMDRSK